MRRFSGVEGSRMRCFYAAKALSEHQRPRVSGLRRALVAATFVALLGGCSGGSGGDSRRPDGGGSPVSTGERAPVVEAPGGANLPPLPVAVPTVWVRADAPEGGDGSAARPFRAIGLALAAAAPGDTVSVGPGVYLEYLSSVRAGEPLAPIRLVGSEAEIRGRGEGRLVQFTHSDITLEGFRLTGADILLWLQSTKGVRVIGNLFDGAGSECVRLKYFARGNEVAHNRVQGCGGEGFDLEEDQKNGEGIYIGTAPEQVSRNPTDEADDSGGNWVHDNSVEVPAECVDVKEGARGNLVEGNDCTGSRDPEGGGFSSRGIGTVFRNNHSARNAGAGIRLGGDDDHDGVNSVVEGNTLVGNRGYGLKVLRRPQARVCGNTVRENGEGPVTEGGPDPSAPCR